MQEIKEKISKKFHLSQTEKETVDMCLDEGKF